VATPTQNKANEKLYSFAFEGAPLEVVMETYCKWTEQIYLKNDNVKATITLKADNLTKQECINVVEAILSMNNIALVPMGEKFVKVVQASAPDVTGQGLELNLDPAKEYTGSDKLVTQVIPLRNVQIPDVQTAVQHLMHAYGKIQTLQRSNSIMVTDTEANILRIRQLVEFLDQATARIEPRIYEIKYAVAADIAAKLNEIVVAAQGDQAKPTATLAGNPNATTPAGVIRARSNRQQRTVTAPTRATVSDSGNSTDVIIQGTVKIMADDRTNIIIIFSQEANFDFFDKIIKVLDVEVDPAVIFEVVNLEYADAAELSSTLNELVGAAQGARAASTASSASRNRTTRGTTQRSNSQRNTRNQQLVTPNADMADGADEQANVEATGIQNLSKLSEDTKILADERSNSILLMGSKTDIAALKNVIASLDVMLEQVVIETVIFDVGLRDGLAHGIDWLYDKGDRIGGWNSSSLTSTTNNILQTVAAGPLRYYQVFSDLDSEMLIRLSQSDSDTRVISTPVIMTTDNTEATLSIGEQRPVITSTDQSLNSTQLRSSYEYKDIGIQLTITPRINPERFVVMELNQKADQLGEIVEIDNNQVPTIRNREFSAQIAVPDGGTVVLGGLISTEMSDTMNKIPILGDIPLIGRYLFSSVTKSENKRELIVLMTPYVMTNMDEMSNQAERLYRGTNLRKEDWNASWSESRLRQIETEKDDIPEPIYGGDEETDR
jgi:general secretion pathway protein D